MVDCLFQIYTLEQTFYLLHRLESDAFVSAILYEKISRCRFNCIDSDGRVQLH
jgi:hypothetical protein